MYRSLYWRISAVWQYLPYWESPEMTSVCKLAGLHPDLSLVGKVKWSKKRLLFLCTQIVKVSPQTDPQWFYLLNTVSIWCHISAQNYLWVFYTCLKQLKRWRNTHKNSDILQIHWFTMVLIGQPKKNVNIYTSVWNWCRYMTSALAFDQAEFSCLLEYWGSGDHTRGCVSIKSSVSPLEFRQKK